MPPEVRAEAPSSTGSLIEALANRVRALHHQARRGDLAELRRMDAAAAPVSPALQRVLAALWPDRGLTESRARRVALFVKILALPMSKEGLEGDANKLGARMADRNVNISEPRVQRLMTARGEALDDQILRLARRLVQAGPLPYVEIGRLILARSEEALESARFDIARGYWTSPAKITDAQIESLPSGDQE